MRSILFGSAVAALLSISLIACVGEDLAQSQAPATPPPAEAGVSIGERGGLCFPNKTCNEGLTCEDGLVCVTSKNTLSTPTTTTSSDAGDAGQNQCKRTGSFTPPWINPPAPKSASCTDSQIAALADACWQQPEGASCMILRGQFASCAACAFGSANDAQWKPILVSGGAPVVNMAGCIDLAGNNPGCGARYARVIACFDRYCEDCTGANETTCQKDVAQGSGECKPYLIDQTCGETVFAVENICFPGDFSDAALRKQFVGVVTTACR